MILTFGYHFLILKLFSLKKPLPKSGLGLKDGWLKQFSQGAIAAGLIILFLWGLIVVCGGMTVAVNDMNGGTVLAIAVMVIRMLCTGFQEEIITRGTVAFSGKSGGKLFSAIIISVIFGLLHGLGTIQGVETIAVNVTFILFSLIVFVLTWITGDLWAAIGVHFAWNTVMGLLGSPISGANFTGIIKSSATGNPIINGGAYGIEGSIFTPVVGILILVVLIVRYRKGCLH
jgi:membrane protease YdiL (CAAX protease family)